MSAPDLDLELWQDARPVEAPDKAVHIVCCDPNKAVCGAVVTKAVPDGTEVDCRLCALADDNDLPCSHPECWGADE